MAPERSSTCSGVNALMSICHVSCLVFLKSLIMDLTLDPTVPGSFAALVLRVTSTSGIHGGGGEEYGKACTREPRPSTAACRAMTRRCCSGVGVDVPLLRADDAAERAAALVFGFLGSGLSISIFLNRPVRLSIIRARRLAGEHLIIPERVAAAPARTSC